MSDRTFLDWPFFDPAQRELAHSLESWCVSNLTQCADEHDEDRRSRQLVNLLGQAGFLKFAVSGESTAKIDVRSLCIIREILARHNSLADFAFAMQGIGSGPISLFGNAEQKEHYLGKVSRGEAIAAFALSEAEAGSDVASITTSVSSDGSEFVINGAKTWISNAGIADFYVVFARSAEAPGAKGLSAFVVDAKTAGLTVSARIKVTSPHPLGSLSFNNCRIPKGARLGNGGDGFKIAMATLDVFRSGVGAAALGFARRALDEALRHTSARTVFGQPLASFQMTQDKLADMATEIDASALLVYRAAWAKDKGAERVTREAAMAKFYATEAAQRVIDHAVQLFGGQGVVSGSVVESLYRDIRPLRIYEGTSEIQKIVIANQILGGK